MVSAEIAQNQKCDLFFEKGVFDLGEKVGFTNCVFEKLCSSENTILVFSARHSSCNKNGMLKSRSFMNNSGFFLNMAKRCFVFFVQLQCYCGLFFVYLVKWQKC